MLEEHNFTKFSKDGKPIKSSEELLTGEDADEEEETQEQEGDEDVGNTSVANIQEGGEQAAHVPETIYSSYDYLLGMAIWSLTYERFMRIMQQRDQKEAELNALLSKSAKDLWNQDLDEFLAEFDKFYFVTNKKENLWLLTGRKNRQREEPRLLLPKTSQIIKSQS